MPKNFKKFLNSNSSGLMTNRISHFCSNDTPVFSTKYYKCNLLMPTTKYLLLGGTGNVGTALTKYLAQNVQNEIFCTHINPKQSTFLKKIAKHNFFSNVQTFLSDIRDYNQVEQVITHINPDVIIILALALDTPENTMDTIVNGAQNVLDVIQTHKPNLNVKVVLNTSSIKAVIIETSVYARAKYDVEQMFINASQNPNLNGIKFVSVRLTSIAEASDTYGCLIFNQIIRNISLKMFNDNAVTTFISSFDESVNLIINAIQYANTGEIWLMKYNSVNINDITLLFSNVYNYLQITNVDYDGLIVTPLLFTSLEQNHLKTFANLDNIIIIEPANNPPIVNNIIFTPKFNYQQLEAYTNQLNIFAPNTYPILSNDEYIQLTLGLINVNLSL